MREAIVILDSLKIIYHSFFLVIEKQHFHIDVEQLAVPSPLKLMLKDASPSGSVTRASGRVTFAPIAVGRP